MNTPKHTPGPWFVGHDKINPLTGDATNSVGPMGYTVAAVRTEGDSRLIAAAPDLLAVASSLLKAEPMQQGERNGAIMGQISIAIDLARAAIAKAVQS